MALNFQPLQLQPIQNAAGNVAGMAAQAQASAASTMAQAIASMQAMASADQARRDRRAEQARIQAYQEQTLALQKERLSMAKKSDASNAAQRLLDNEYREKSYQLQLRQAEAAEAWRESEALRSQGNTDRAFEASRDDAARAQANVDRAYTASRDDAARAQANVDRAFEASRDDAEWQRNSADRNFVLAENADKRAAQAHISAEEAAAREALAFEQSYTEAQRRITKEQARSGLLGEFADWAEDESNYTQKTASLATFSPLGQAWTGPEPMSGPTRHEQTVRTLVANGYTPEAAEGEALVMAQPRSDRIYDGAKVLQWRLRLQEEGGMTQEQASREIAAVIGHHYRSEQDYVDSMSELAAKRHGSGYMTAARRSETVTSAASTGTFEPKSLAVNWDMFKDALGNPTLAAQFSGGEMLIKETMKGVTLEPVYDMAGNYRSMEFYRDGERVKPAALDAEFNGGVAYGQTSQLPFATLYKIANDPVAGRRQQSGVIFPGASGAEAKGAADSGLMFSGPPAEAPVIPFEAPQLIQGGHPKESYYSGQK